MRIKLSKQNWRLVGQKMGWLKRAQIETNNGAGVFGSRPLRRSGRTISEGSFFWPLLLWTFGLPKQHRFSFCVGVWRISTASFEWVHCQRVCFI